MAEPLGAERTRMVSRYRCACSDDMRTRLTMGPALLERIGSTMDRRMLLGVAARVRETRDRAPRRLRFPRARAARS